MDAALQNEISGLRKLPTLALKVRYDELFREQSPSNNRAHLIRRIAWRLQAVALGDLSERARARASELAADADLRVRPTRRVWQAISAEPEQEAVTQRDPRVPAVGRTITREYQGRSIQVRVVESGYEYNGKTYGSLSAVAYHATGTRWNGYAFFKLKGGPKHA